MHSIHNIVESLNDSLGDLFSSKRLVGSKLHGIAITISTGTERLPVIMDKTGNGTYVGLDDRYPVRLYHKHNSMTTRTELKTSVGRGIGDIINTHSLAMIVFLNRKRTGLMPDEFLLLIQSNLPDFIKMDPFNSIEIRFVNSILNDLQVYNQEYQTEKDRLLPEHNLFLINYTVETAFKKRCFNKCPED